MPKFVDLTLDTPLPRIAESPPRRGSGGVTEEGKSEDGVDFDKENVDALLLTIKATALKRARTVDKGRLRRATRTPRTMTPAMLSTKKRLAPESTLRFKAGRKLLSFDGGEDDDSDAELRCDDSSIVVAHSGAEHCDSSASGGDEPLPRELLKRLSLAPSPLIKTRAQKKRVALKSAAAGSGRLATGKTEVKCRLRSFGRRHSFGPLLVEAAENGSGCLLFNSFWDGCEAVTKLLPMFASEGFSQRESGENARRECDLHLRALKASGTSVVHLLATAERVRDPKGHGPYLALVMQKLDCSLKHLRRPLTATQTLHFLDTGLSLLSALSAADLIHNDLKLENVFVRKEPKLQFFFGDFGCSALSTEEFPYGDICGTLTMWDSESLGSRYGRERGFSRCNECYAMLGCAMDALIGYSLIEELATAQNENYDELGWKQYTNVLRKERRKMLANGGRLMKDAVELRLAEDKAQESGSKERRSRRRQVAVLRKLLSQLTLRRAERMPLVEMRRLLATVI